MSQTFTRLDLCISPGLGVAGNIWDDLSTGLTEQNMAYLHTVGLVMVEKLHTRLSVSERVFTLVTQRYM